MKTEQFDDEIRRKIERLNFPPAEEDIDRVHAYVKLHQLPTFWGRFGKIIAYSTTAVVLTSSIIYNLLQHNENKTLLNDIANIKQQQAEISPNKSVADAEKIQPKPRVDTVYVTRYVNVPNRREEVASSEKIVENTLQDKENKAANLTENSTKLHPAENEIADEKAKNGNSMKPESTTEIVKNGVLSTKITPNESNIPQKDNKSTKLNNEQTKNANEKNKSNETQNFSTLEPQPKLKFDKNSVENQTNLSSKNAGENPSNGESSGGTPPSVKKEENRLVFTESELKNKSFSIDSMNELRDKFPAVAFVNRRRSEPTKRRSNFKFSGLQFPSLSLKGVSFRTGLTGEFAHEQLGGGIIGEALLGKHFGLSVGLKTQVNFDEKYFTDEHYEEKNHQDFRQTYAPKVPDSEEILNIGFNKTVITMPVQLSYYQPLTHDFWFFGSAGTNIDLAASQEVHYDFRANQNEFKPGNDESKLKVTPLNNAFFSVGIEKRLKYFDFQVSPIFTAHFKDVSYCRDNRYWGGQFRVFYRFK